MSVDTRLILSQYWSVEDVIEVLEKHFGYTCKPFTHSSINPSAYLFYSLRKDEVEAIGINIHPHHEFMMGMYGILLTTRATTEGLYLLLKLGKHMGGLYCAEDITEGFTLFPTPSQGESAFLLKEAIKQLGPCAENTVKVSEFIRDWKPGQDWGGTNE